MKVWTLLVENFEWENNFVMVFRTKSDAIEWENEYMDKRMVTQMDNFDNKQPTTAWASRNEEFVMSTTIEEHEIND